MNAETESGGKTMDVVALAVKSAGGKGSQRAVRWASERSTWKDYRFVLVHVMPSVTVIPTPSGDRIPIDELDAKVVEIYMEDMRAKSEEIFIPYKKLLKGRNMEKLVLEGDNPASTLLAYMSDSGISTLVLGSCSSRNSCICSKPKSCRVPSDVLKNAPPTCNIHVVSQHGFITNTTNSSLDTDSSCKEMLITKKDHGSHKCSKQLSQIPPESRIYKKFGSLTNADLIGPSSHKSKQKCFHVGSFMEQYHKNVRNNVSDSQTIKDSCSLSPAYSDQSDIQADVERLRQELQSTLALYTRAYEDLIYAQEKVDSLSFECQEEERRVSAAQEREESLRKMAAKQKEKHSEALKEVEMARNQCAKEAHERQIAELNALKKTLEKEKVVESLITGDKRYRRYDRSEIETATDFFSEAKLIGEGAYGKVYKCDLDHTPVAIKVLWSDASDKKEEFLREIEVLSIQRHPHIVLLLGACPEIGCLIYEYMENGSLEDYILRRSSRPPLPWFIRFRIVYEVACGLAFLHNCGPEPIVHRDLKPGNILLDRNYVSKIGDVGLAKIILDVVPDNVTEYRNSILAGTLCYMDPEYQRTGTLRPKSDLYALGIIILQLLTARQPNGIILKVENAVKSSTFSDVLDKSVTDWPLPKTEELAQVALKCCKLRCRDRPDLETEVLPVLKRLSEFADATIKAERTSIHAPSHYYCPILQEIMDDPYIAADGFTYEHIAIKTWVDRHDVSPVTRLRLQNKTLTPNHVLRSAIREWTSLVTSSG